MFVALYPEEPLFNGEHLTITWMDGRSADPHRVEMARMFTAYIDAVLRRNPFEVSVIVHDTFGVDEHRVKVAIVSDRNGFLESLHDSAVNLGLSDSEHAFTPHLSFKGGDGRAVGEAIFFNECWFSG